MLSPPNETIQVPKDLNSTNVFKYYANLTHLKHPFHTGAMQDSVQIMKRSPKVLKALIVIEMHS